MNQQDADKMKSTLKPASRGEPFACADCGFNATCPMLKTSVWEGISPRINDACSTCEQVHNGYWTPRHRWTGKKTNRDLLCLECAEARLGRDLTLDDLEVCLANYAPFVMQARAAAPCRTGCYTLDLLKKALETLNPQWCPLCGLEVWSGLHKEDCPVR